MPIPAKQLVDGQLSSTNETFAGINDEKTAHRAKRELSKAKVKELHDQGLSQREIARRLKIHPSTVKKYINAPSCPVYRLSIKRKSKLDPYLDYIKKRIVEGCRKATVIFDELRQLGFDGSYSLVAKKVVFLQEKVGESDNEFSQHSVVRWSSSRGAWLLVKPFDQLTVADKAVLQQIIKTDVTIENAYTLGQRFCSMIRQQNEEELLPWLEDVAESGITAMKNFAKGIKADISAVTNALRLPWSQGQTEGQVNRLKLIKRKMYGRANFDLLRKRVLVSTT